MHNVQFTRVSRNSKTGPIPVTTTAKESCPDSCALKAGGCYAKGGPLALIWNKVSEGTAGLPWAGALAEIRKLPKGTLWRHNQAGDLPGMGDEIDGDAMRALVAANKGRNGFTYTHKPLTPDNAREIRAANANGFTVNLSADNLAEADRLAESGVGPVVVVLPSEAKAALRTPSGRRVAICPATISEAVNCASCGLCAVRDRKAIIGFPAHGASKRKASAVAMGIAA